MVKVFYFTKIQSNNHNLPFQIKWSNNLQFNYKPLIKVIKMIVDSINKNYVFK